MSEITIRFPGGKRVDAIIGRHVIHTDQPVSGGGEDSAPAPFDVFLASLGACAGIYVLGFCQNRGLPIDGITLRQRARRNPENHVLEHVEIEIAVPPGFPARYHEALVRVADQCAVKKAIAAQPTIAVRTQVVEREAA